MTEFLNYMNQLPLLELVAVITAFLYVILAAKGHIYCWFFAIASTIIYTYIFYDVYLWMDSLLQVYYFGMAIYGWYCWGYKDKSNKAHATRNFIIVTLPIFTHIKYGLVLLICSLSVGYLMDVYTPTDFPYLDALTTVFAVFATYLVTQKVLENWLYWIVIDAVSIYLYIEKSLTPTAILFVFYVFIAIYGYYKWLTLHKSLNEKPLV